MGKFRVPTTPEQWAKQAEVPPAEVVVNPEMPEIRVAKVQSALSAEGPDTGPTVQRYPWMGLNPKVIKYQQVRLPEPLHAKLMWLASHVGGESGHSIALKGIEEKVNALLIKQGVDPRLV
jgi:hypothetical protein